MSIRENIVDLLDPFKSGWYYNSAMGKSFSIKSVLPRCSRTIPNLIITISRISTTAARP